MEKKNILVIDDESDIREFLCTLLKSKGYNVIETDDGTKAIKLVDLKQPDLIISDLLLPGIHGLEVIKYIKDKYFIPVIAISGIYNMEEIKKYIDELYIDNFIEKPINATILIKTVEKIFKDINKT